MKTLIAAILIGGLTLGATAESLDIYFIDVEGGQATLIVTPAKQALLVDGGWAGFDGRDAKRVLAAARDAGVARLDYLVATHFHGDHIGAIPELTRLIPIETFIDYDRPVETTANVVVPYSAYAAARARAKHVVARPGDRIPLDGVEVRVLTAGGESISAPLDGAGQGNPACATLDAHGDDPSENRRSVSLRIMFGRFRFLDLADLNWNPLVRLVCPNNLIGTTDLFLVPHHSNSDAGVPAVISAVVARAIVSNNSATKGGAADTFAMLHRLRGPADVWQLHRSERTGAENFSEELIANLDGGESGHWIKVSAMSDGSFVVTNARNGVSRTYR